MKDYPPGHFTALIKRHNWPPMFTPRMTFETPKQRAAAYAGRIAAETGTAWGGAITMDLPGTPMHIRRRRM